MVTMSALKHNTCTFFNNVNYLQIVTKENHVFNLHKGFRAWINRIYSMHFFMLKNNDFTFTQYL